MSDKAEIVNHCLREFYILENHNLHKLVNRYQLLVSRMESQILRFVDEVSNRNRLIADLRNRLLLRNRICVMNR